MVWTEIWAAVKLIITALPAEVNLTALESTTWQVFEAGWTKGAWLAAVIANANVIFPDVRSRQFVVVVLQGMLYLINAAKPGGTP